MNSLRTKDGESYGSILEGCDEGFEGVAIRRFEGVMVLKSSCLRFRDIGAGDELL